MAIQQPKPTPAKSLWSVIIHSPALIIAGVVLFFILLYLLSRRQPDQGASQGQPGQTYYPAADYQGNTLGTNVPVDQANLYNPNLGTTDTGNQIQPPAISQSLSISPPTPVKQKKPKTTSTKTHMQRKAAAPIHTVTAIHQTKAATIPTQHPMVMRKG